MGTEQQRVHGDSSDASAASGLLRPLRTALADAGESERYRLLAALLSELADQSANGRPRGSAEEIEARSREIHTLRERIGLLEDTCKTNKADFDRQGKQLEAEQTRGHELELINQEQRARLERLQKDQRDLEAQLVARNEELHKAHVENEQLLLKVQREELGRNDHSGVERLEAAKHELGKEVKALRTEMEQLRADKDAEIARLNDELANHRAPKADATDIPFTALWGRLASSKPPLADGRVQPNEQCAQRMVDGFIELVRFVDDFDRFIHPFLSKYTKKYPPIKVPWEVYAKRDTTRKTVEQTLVVVGGKPIGVVKVRLRGLYAWTHAAMLGCDAAIESVGSELHS
ncbi:MAG: hypothetical protein WBE26_04865, partial [Phycisphaerae bacterium]